MNFEIQKEKLEALLSVVRDVLDDNETTMHVMQIKHLEDAYNDVNNAYEAQSSKEEKIQAFIKKYEGMSNDDQSLCIEMFDETVYDLCSEEGSSINNSGIEEQIRFVEENGGMGFVENIFNSIEDSKEE